MGFSIRRESLRVHGTRARPSRLVDESGKDVPVDGPIAAVEIRTVRALGIDQPEETAAAGGVQVEEVKVHREWAPLERAADEITVRVKVYPATDACRFSAVPVQSRVMEMRILARSTLRIRVSITPANRVSIVQSPNVRARECAQETRFLQKRPGL